jgi:alcohol dehydrogenase
MAIKETKAKNIPGMQICYPKTVYAGWESLQRIANIIDDLNMKEVCLITDKVIRNAGVVDSVIEILENKCEKLYIYDDIPAEPTNTSIVNTFKTIAENEPQFIVAVGGGSVIDTAKLISLLLVNQQYVEKLDSIPSQRLDKVPCIVLPTTSGTGAEVTANSVVLFPERDLKVGVLHPDLIPDYVILDTALTLSLPPQLTATTGIDALCHAIESFISLKSSSFSKLYSIKATELICANLLPAYSDGRNIEARENMQLGAFYAGLCLNTSSTVAVHALSYPLGGKYHLPHGYSNAILLPYVFDAMKDEINDELTLLAPYMIQGIQGENKAQQVIDYLFDLLWKLNISTDLQKYNVSKTDLDYLTDNAMKVTRLLDNNPKKFSRDEIYAIYDQLI